MEQMTERIVSAERVEDLIAVFGSFDENIKQIEAALEVSIVNRGEELKVSGSMEAVDKAVRTLNGLLSLAAKGEIIDEQRVRYLITLVLEGRDDQVSKMAMDVVCITAKGKPIKAKTVTSASVLRTICAKRVDLPPPAAAKMPIRWPSPQVSKASSERMPRAMGLEITVRSNGLGGSA